VFDSVSDAVLGLCLDAESVVQSSFICLRLPWWQHQHCNEDDPNIAWLALYQTFLLSNNFEKKHRPLLLAAPLSRAASKLKRSLNTYILR